MTSDYGQTRNNRRIEYFSEGGVMELNSSHIQKKVIDCVELTDPMLDNHSCDKRSYYFADLSNNYVGGEFFANSESSTSYNYKDILGWCANILEFSPSAGLMLKEAKEKNWRVMLEDLCGGDYCIDVEQKLLIIDNNSLDARALGRSSYFRNITIIIMVRALRDIWQEKRHGGFDDLYSPENIMLMERIRVADLDVISILVAWELRSEEFSEIWRHIIGSEIGDMAMVFSGYLERYPSSLFNGQGLVSTFKQWFESEKRLDACDHDVLEYLDDVLIMSDISNPFGNKKPAKMSVEMISCLPDKTAYLQGQGAEILSNPKYSAINNEINQTHLFHIIYDLEATIVRDVPFRDKDLARKIFPKN